ncbi:MAG: error-prone DNA polymerase [Deltaproteobacteria bacterium]|nr:error-prone DNA polymerase [Deltaproteobacteria bacterium]
MKLPTRFAELQSTSNFSFLTGASHPEELVQKASELGYHALAITDLNSLAGVVRAHAAAKTLDMRFHVGCRLRVGCEEAIPGAKDLCQELDLLAYPTSREAYGRLCRLLTLGKLRAEKGGCLLTLKDLYQHQQGLTVTIVPPFFDTNFANAAALNFMETCKELKESLNETAALSLSITRNYSHNNFHYTNVVTQTSRYLSLPLIVSSDAYYHFPGRRALCDLVTCIREGCTIQQAGFRLFQNSERYLKPLHEIERLYRDLPEAISRTIEVSDMLNGFSLNQLRYEYPDESPEGIEPIQHLTELTYRGAGERYPGGVPEKVLCLIEQELALIHELKYEKYFLTCYDIVKFARSKGILCQGRGAAANSAVCFSLGITSVDPDRIDILFARFVSKERDEPPDIDIDFEHERREEVIQYIYGKYGREHAGLTCEVVTYQPRSAVRDVGKALGLSLEIVDRLAKSIHRWTACELSREALEGIGLNPDDTTIKNALHLTSQLLDFPRHISQHVGGFIISATPLCEIVPILNAAMPDRTIIEWNKDDIEALGILKIDVLGLGMLSCIRKALALINEGRSAAGAQPLEMHAIPAEDSAVYDMICLADTVGVFQIESRAQMSMLPRLRPRCFYDLVIEVAIVRPGPIQGNMVHPFLKRRSGLEKVSFPDEKVRDVLGKTLGVPIFQEQAMRLAIVLANFTPGEAEQLRRAMAAWKHNEGLISRFKKRIVKGMLESGYTAEFAETCMQQIRGFSEYGFPESHAASFALLVYASAWIKRYYPAQFAAALINSQPMGFYAPAQLVQDAKNHGVSVLPVDVNFSSWDCSIEDSDSLRLGMRLVRGLEESQAEMIAKTAELCGKASSIREIWMRCHQQGLRLRIPTLKLLANADAFASMGLSRREAFWQIEALPPQPLPLDSYDKFLDKEGPSLPRSTVQQEMFDDYTATGLSLRSHPIQFIRPALQQRRVQKALELKEIVKANLKGEKVKKRVAMAGIAIIRQRPGTARGVVFITLEDESGVANLIIRPQVFEAHTKIVLTSSCLLAHGFLENIGEVVYINVERLESLDKEILAAKRSPLPNRSFSY